MDKKVENISFRKAEIEDIAILCELLWELFSQEVEFTPNKETQEKALKKIIEDKSFTAIEKLTILLTKDVTNAENKDEMLKEFHQAGDAEMHLRSLVISIERLTPLITDVVLQGIEEGVFNTPYPKETVENILVILNMIFDEGVFQWTAEEKIQKAKGLAYLMEKSLGAEKGSFDFMTESPVVKDSINNKE